MQLSMYEHLKRAIHSTREQNVTASRSLPETASITAISAATANSVASVIRIPLDMVKTRMMLSALDNRGDHSSSKFAGSKPRNKISTPVRERGSKNIDVARQVLAENGVKGLFRGASLRSTWSALASGLYLGVYESGRVWLREWRTGASA